MLVVLEGVDGSGKSSLADAIAREIQDRTGEPVEQHHHGPLERDPVDEYVFDIQDYFPGSGRHLVIDRLHWGELVYGPIYRDKSAVSEAQFRWIELWLQSRGAAIFHVTQPLEVIQRRLAARGEDFLRPEHVKHVLSGFAAVAKKAITHQMDVSPEGDTARLVGKIVDSAAYAETRVAQLASVYPSLIGDPLPHTLLVGDKRGGKPPHPTTSAFLPVAANSSVFLLEALDSDWWRGVAIVNGVEEANRLPHLIDDLYGPNVVALGRNASDILIEYDIEHAAVPHPQYARRFQNKRQRQYGALIQDVARTGEVRISWPN